MDAEPLRSKQSTEVKNALLKIFKRKIIKPPETLECDNGGEFKAEFYNHFSKLFKIRYKIPYRHRSQSVVESKNYVIGHILNKIMLAAEINNDQISRDWVYILPRVIKEINNHYKKTPESIDVEAPIHTDKLSENILPVGTKVRVQLDVPEDFLTGSRLVGKFRTGDLRWTKDIHTITQFFLRPGQPILYQVDDDNKAAYTRNQLQLVKDNEQLPSQKNQNKFIVKKIVKKVKKKNQIFYEVEWKTGEITLEPRKNLILDIPEMLKEFEGNHKKL
jgi:hypothetical protein